MQTVTIPQALDLALQHLGAGRLAEAEAIYRQILAQEPQHADAWHFLGVIAGQVGRHDMAANFARQAIAVNPAIPGCHNGLGIALATQGRFDEAITAYRRAVELKPDYVEAHNNLANALRDAGRLDQAIAAYRRALHFKADSAEIHYNLGNALKDDGQIEEAVAAYRRAAEIKPDFADARNNLGGVLRMAGRSEAAIAAYREAIRLKPDFASVHGNLGNALTETGRFADAVAAYRRAIEITPVDAEAHNWLGIALRGNRQFADAVAAHRRAIELRPDFAEAHNNLGNALKDQGLLEDAIAAFRRAIALKPDYKDAHSNLIFVLDLLDATDVAQGQAERRRWSEEHGKKFAVEIRPHENERNPGRRLRVGYVSADFRRHSACYVFGPVIRSHDRAGFEVFCYSGVERDDDVTARLREAADVWRPTVRMSDEALTGQIRRDRIDILVDLSGHTAGNRLLVFARKPAPVQVTAWGHATGTGLRTVDYFFADPLVVPAETRALYAEEVIDLPCVLFYEPPADLPEVSALPALEGNPLTYGCVNRLEKITDRIIGLWGRVLQEAPGARLLVKDAGLDDAGLRRQFLRRLHEVGRIEASRVLLMGYSRHAEHLATFHRIDLGLDPFPQGGGVSTAEALWMGVPLVTLEGATVPGRISASVLNLIGMHDWVAQTDDDYVRIALGAGRDLSRVAKLRKDLRERLKASPYGDVQRYTRAVEQAYRKMWRTWCARQSSGPPRGRADR